MTAILNTLFRRKKVAGADLPETDEESRYRPIELGMVRKMLGALAPYKWAYIAGISICWMQVMLDLLGPQFIGAIINFVGDVKGNVNRQQSAGIAEWLVKHLTSGTPANLLTAKQAIWHLTLIVGLWGVAIAGSIVLQRWALLILQRVGENVQFDLRRKVFAHLQKLDMGFYDRTKLGRIISRCTSDINGLREVNVWGICHIIIQSSAMAIAAAMLMYTDWRLFLAVAWLGPVLYWVNLYFIRSSAAQWQVVREGFTRVSTNLAENINGMRVVTAFNRQDPNLRTFNRLQVDNTTNNLAAARLNGTYQPTLEVIRYVGRAIILVYGGYLVASGQMLNKGVGGVVQAYLYWDWFMNPIVVLGNFYNQLMMAMAGAERVFALLETQPTVADLPGAKPLPRIEGRVRFENVTFGYNPDRPVLHNVTFEAKPGQMFALVGHTGSGKSSIISLISRFYQPQQGRVLVDEQDIRFVQGESLHKQTGLVLQVNYLFTGTVLDNLRYATPHHTEEDVMRAARELGTYDAIMNLKDGLQTDVGERGASMSLGQRQLICFTRAYLADPRIFMLDEATSAVDTGTEAVIQESLEKLLKGRTTFIVAHRLSTIMRADCILVIDQGHVIERGTHDELIAQGDRYAHLYEQFTSSVGEH
jgi:ATP-binding cassette subfamily B protein